MRRERSGFREVRLPNSPVGPSSLPKDPPLRPMRPNYDPDEGQAGSSDVWAVLLAILLGGFLVLGLVLLVVASR